MVKILVVGPRDFRTNRGGMAIVMGLANCLRRYMPDIEITMLTYQPAEDERFGKLGIETRAFPWQRNGPKLLSWTSYLALTTFDLLRCLAFRLVGKFKHRIKHPYSQYNAVIHVNTDGMKDPDNGPFQTIKCLIEVLLLWAVCHRPTASVPTDLGPFTTRLTAWLARFALNKVDILALREEVSYKHAQQLQLTKPTICLASDTAFFLDPACEERVAEIWGQEHIARSDKPLIGLSPSQWQMEYWTSLRPKTKDERQSKYIELMAAMTDYLVDRLGAIVCLIPHVYPDDREACHQIYEQTKHSSAVGLLEGEYLADELKGIIGSCDMFLGCRMHSTIASTSMGIPTIAIGHGDKFHRLIGETMGQEEYIINIQNSSFNELLVELKLKIDSLWANRQRVREELRERTRKAQDRVSLYGKLVHELAESSKEESG